MCIFLTCIFCYFRYDCLCSRGYTGRNCTELIVDCNSSPCQNGGTCSFDTTTQIFTCSCPTGWNGTTCNEDVNECLQSPDICNATSSQSFCNNTFGGYHCVCQAGYNGTFCDQELNECQLYQPCLNGATCFDLINDYSCTCLAGYTGKNCSSNINECASSPCRNGGSCSDLINGYQCNCAVGYTGTHCETEINECLSSPCQNGATCTDLIGDYNCTCTVGFTSKNCDVMFTATFRNDQSYLDAGLVMNNRQRGWITFRFRTTIADGVLLYNGDVSMHLCPPLLLLNIQSCNYG